MIESSEKTMVELDQRIREKIEILAYCKAERRGLEQPGHEIDDWVEAEQEVLCSLQQT